MFWQSMNKLFIELQRLYFHHNQHSRKLSGSGESLCSTEVLLTAEVLAKSLAGETNVVLDLLSSDGTVRAMIIDFSKASDWEQVAKLYQVCQNDLNLPAPAVSVSGDTAYRLWISLTEPVPVAQARAFLHALRLKFLVDIPHTNIRLCPDPDNSPESTQYEIAMVPALHRLTEKWSAFIDPSMVSMFVDGPWLEMAPNMDKQADILGRLTSISADDFERALAIIQAPLEPLSNVKGSLNDAPGQDSAHTDRVSNLVCSALRSGKSYSDPQSFLLAVMNDSSAKASQRIKAAKALLPYFNTAASESNDNQNILS